jgi:peroxiredoxin/tetratricopeptide (TPR) repeat protein
MSLVGERLVYSRMAFNKTLVACLGLLSLAGGARAEEARPAPVATEAAKLAGHSYHGESFNEGPRQKGALRGDTGIVRFPVTTKSEEAQRYINQGVGQLHGFWYYEAERSFRQAAHLDPNCALAYWGMSLANTNNEKRARAFIAEGIKRKAGVGERELMYLEALDAFHKADPQKDKERHEAYARALEKILFKFPDDIEAKAFLGLQLWLNRSKGSPIVSQLAVDALLKEVLAVEPMHPCHHYRIHLWDTEQASLALNSAARIGQAAPGIAHMWHMSGHTFARLERFHDAAWQQEASARVDHAYMMRDRIFPDQIHNYAHNNEWLVRDLSHVGRVRDAIELAKNLSELPRHPKYNTLSNDKSAHFGRLRLFDELTRFELWNELIRLAATQYLEPTDLPAEQVKRLRYLGGAHLRLGDIDAGRSCIADLQARLLKARGLPSGAELRPEPVARPSAEDGKPLPKSDAENARDAACRPIELALDELRGHIAVLQEEYARGLKLLDRGGGIDPLYLASLRWKAGEKEQALKDARAAVESHKNQVRPLAGLVELLWQSGERAEATERFAVLRERAGRADLDVPPLARLAPIAEALSYPKDWRIPPTQAADAGDRPPLESLGPFRWSPGPAQDWSLPDAAGNEISLAHYRGKPVIVIFYLGYQCLHCAEQLQKFAPMTKEFEENGIALVAISTDDRTGLQKSLENYKTGVFPFPLVSDPTFDVFKAWRVFDDFENKPLHGLFFVDGAGLVRWHDISYEPFQDPKFLLNEAKRLLSLTVWQ